MTGRRRAAVLLAAVAAVVTAFGLALTVLGVPHGRGGWPTGPNAIRAEDFTAYTAPNGILFDVGSDRLRPEATAVLQAIAARIARSGHRGPIRVEGYTDSTGSDADNVDLSRDRADTVADWLGEHADVDRGWLQVIPYGEASPAQPNDTDEHRRANRRVVIRVRR